MFKFSDNRLAYVVTQCCDVRVPKQLSLVLTNITEFALEFPGSHFFNRLFGRQSLYIDSTL